MVSYENVDDKLLSRLKNHGFQTVKTKTKYEKTRFQGISTVILFNTGKLLVQGTKESVESTRKILEFLGIPSKEKKFHGLAVGSDETLKGDTFGGIVVAGFLADDTTREQLIDLKVRDSKRLTTAQVCELAKKLIEIYPGHYSVESLFPKEYNKLNTRKNVTEILNDLHLKCYKKLIGRKRIIHIVDKFPGCQVGDIIEAKAESRYYEVAAASCIARYFGLKQIRELEQRAGLIIPLGSTNVYSALIHLKKKSLNPADYVKLEFKNVRELFG
ncbi:hypothetical protein JW930_07665 [Candidatus Woesearchaeota archaeon]|nr:hypothetical protein [Candidatus Woesearchaeota archaeon]